MNVIDVLTECLNFVEALSPEDRANMLALVALDRPAVLRVLAEARAARNNDAVRFAQVAVTLHVIVDALRSLGAEG